MLTAQRQQAIVDYIRKHTYADIDALSAELAISPATVRRDLRFLSERGIITRTRGGATLPMPGVGHEPPYVARAKERQVEKRAIAQLACTFIQEGEVVGLDVGSTTLELARQLAGRQRLTVFSGSFPVAQALTQGAVSLIMVGGLLRKRELALSGPLAVQTVNQFHFDHFFLGLAGITVEDGLTDFSIEDIEVKKAFIARSREVIALADSTKLGSVSFAKICDVDQVKCLITDAAADPAQVERLTNAGLTVLIAHVGDSHQTGENP